MRKIKFVNVYLTDKVFEPKTVVIITDQNGVNEKLVFDKTPMPSEVDLLVVDINNQLLRQGKPVLTDQEIEQYKIQKNLEDARQREDLDDEKLQRLAGFKVEKKIEYLDGLETRKKCQ